MSQSEYATEVFIKDRDDGYVAIHTHEHSAMGRRVLLLNPDELDSLTDKLCSGDARDASCSGRGDDDE